MQSSAQSQNGAIENGKPKTRMNWLDGARLAAAFFIIAIHTSSDSQGGAFKNEEIADRAFPALFRSFAEIASTEFFILVSLFLLSMSLAKQSAGYLETMLIQARRLLVPFFAWTIFYAFFRLYKAYSLGYEDAIFDQLASMQVWIGYFFLGNVNYHMHFLPTLFLLLLFHRVYKLAIDFPMLGLIIIPMLYLNISLQDWIWSTLKDRTVIDYCVRLVKVLTYTGYGFFAYSLYGIWKRGFDKDTSSTLLGFASLLLFTGLLIKAIYAYKVGVSGEFIVRRDMIYYAHYLFPCALLIAFFASQYMPWPDKLSNWSKFSFGMYLIHPAVIDLIDMAIGNAALSATAYVLTKYTFTASVTFCIAVTISRIPLLAWTIGLGPLPSIKSFSSKALRSQHS